MAEFNGFTLQDIIEEASRKRQATVGSTREFSWKSAIISPCKTFRGCERLLSQHSENLDILIYTEIFRCENEKQIKQRRYV